MNTTLPVSVDHLQVRPSAGGLFTPTLLLFVECMEVINTRYKHILSSDGCDNCRNETCTSLYFLFIGKQLNLSCETNNELFKLPNKSFRINRYLDLLPKSGYFPLLCH